MTKLSILSKKFLLSCLLLVGLLHGDMNQFDRNKIISSFKKKEIAVLVATDVAGLEYDFDRLQGAI